MTWRSFSEEIASTWSADSRLWLFRLCQGSAVIVDVLAAYTVQPHAAQAQEHATPKAARLTIEDWRACLAQCKRVVAVRPLLKKDGSSKKSSGSHLSPYELCVFVDRISRAWRLTMGFTGNRGFLHVYCRPPPKRVIGAAADIFREACQLFDAMAEA